MKRTQMENEMPSRRMHILFVLENYWPNIGGVENLFKKLAENLSAQGHRITIITTRLSKSDSPRQTIDNIHIYRYRFFNRYFFTFFAVFPALWHARSCDLVHTTSYNAALPAFIAARLTGKKVIVTFHEVWTSLWYRLPFMGWISKRLHFLFEQLLLQLPFDRFVGVSGSTSESLHRAGVPERRIATIFNGIDYKDFDTSKKEVTPAPSRPFTYTYFGRLGVSKGLDILLEAASIFQHKYPESRLRLIVPKVPEWFLSHMLEDIRRKSLTNQVELLHHLPFDTLKTALQTSDCVVIPSLSEGFCFAAVESIALGIPVISSGKTALREVVSGKFIELETLTPEALATALEQGRAGEWATSPVRKFDIADTVAGYMALYQSTLNVYR